MFQIVWKWKLIRVLCVCLSVPRGEREWLEVSRVNWEKNSVCLRELVRTIELRETFLRKNFFENLLFEFHLQIDFYSPSHAYHWRKTTNTYLNHYKTVAWFWLFLYFVTKKLKFWKTEACYLKIPSFFAKESNFPFHLSIPTKSRSVRELSFSTEVHCSRTYLAGRTEMGPKFGFWIGGGLLNEMFIPEFTFILCVFLRDRKSVV